MQTISDYIHDSCDGRINITINTGIYSLEAIHLAAYQYTNNYHILINPYADNMVIVVFEAKKKTHNITEDLKEFANSLIDHQVRLQLDKANGRIRDLIVSHAFSPLDLNKEIQSL